MEKAVTMRDYKSKIMEVEQTDEKKQSATPPVAQPTPVATEQPVEKQVEQSATQSTTTIPATSIPQEKEEPIISEEQKDKPKMQIEGSVGVFDPKVGYDKIDEAMKASNSSIERKKREEIEEKRRKRASIFNAISDGVAALANVYFASKGAPAVVYNENNSLSARARARWDEIDKKRKIEEEKQYLRDKEKREEQNRLALQKYNQKRQAMLDEENREERAWRKEFQQKTLDNQKEIAELNATVRRENTIAANEREAAKQKAITYRTLAKGGSGSAKKSVTPLYIGGGEVIEVPTNALRDIKNKSAIYNALPEAYKQDAFKRFNLGEYSKQKQLTPAQMEQIIGEYIEEDGAEEARKIIRSLADTQGNNGSSPKTKADYDKYKTTSTQKKDYSQYKE